MGVLQDVVKIDKWLLWVSTTVPLPHMRTSCPHDIVGSGPLGSTLGECKVTGVIMHGSWCSASASVKGKPGSWFSNVDTWVALLFHPLLQ